jgi:hypothetical protein
LLNSSDRILFTVCASLSMRDINGYFFLPLIKAAAV